MEKNQILVFELGEIKFYENDFEILIEEACRIYKINDLVQEKQRRWKRVLKYVGQHLFGDKKILRDKNIIFINNNKIPTNNNRFDYEALNSLCDYYMDLSDRYNKLISAEAFALFLNIPRTTIVEWQHEEPGSLRNDIHKKLKFARLECLKDDAYDNGNVTGTMYVGNVEFGTNLPGTHNFLEEKRKFSSLIEIPKKNEMKLSEEDDF